MLHVCCICTLARFLISCIGLRRKRIGAEAASLPQPITTDEEARSTDDDAEERRRNKHRKLVADTDAETTDEEGEGEDGMCVFVFFMTHNTA